MARNGGLTGGVSVSVEVTPSEGSGVTHTLTFAQPRILVGRGRAMDVRLPTAAVSAHHLTILADAGTLAVQDEGSRNGTLAGGVPLPPGRKKSMASGDVVIVPGFRLKIVRTATGADPAGLSSVVARRLLVATDPGASFQSAVPELALVVPRPREREPERVWPLSWPGTRLRIGRGSECEVRLEDPSLSRVQATVERDDDGLVIRDAGGETAVFVNDRRVREHRLRDGEIVRVGACALVCRDPVDVVLRSLDVLEDVAAQVTPPPPDPVPEPEPPPAALATPAPAPTPRAAPEIPPALARSTRPRSSFRVADGVFAIVAFTVLALSLSAIVLILHNRMR